MARSWIHLLSIVFLLIGLYVFTDLFIALLALLLLITFVVISVLLLFFMKRNILIELEAGWSTYKSEEATIRLHMKNKHMLPMTKITCELLFHNRLTDEKMTKKLFLMVKGREDIDVPLHFHSDQVGRIEVSIQRLTVYDYLQLLGVSIPTTSYYSTYIIPNHIPIQLIEQHEQIGMESSIQAMHDRKDLNGMNMIGIKEYAEEDNIKHIHWKLTDKFNYPIVKEFSEPLEENVLVIYDTVYLQHPKEISTSIEVFMSLSKSLIDQNYEHKLSWFDHDMNTMKAEQIQMKEQLISLQSELLSIKHRRKQEEAFEEFVMNTFHAYSHIYFITSESNTFLAELNHMRQLTVLMYMQETANPPLDNENYIAFTANSLEKDLSYLAI